MLTPTEAARQYGVDRQLIYRLIYANKLKAQRRGRGRRHRWLIEESELFKFAPERSVIVGQLLGALRSLESLHGELEGILEAQVNQELTLRKLTKK